MTVCDFPYFATLNYVGIKLYDMHMYNINKNVTNRIDGDGDPPLIIYTSLIMVMMILGPIKKTLLCLAE